ncbi:MAG: hypothetical protein GQ538_09475 [Xanthomonadales bacterium]|nr:hypothetical protein [Xanthomonadales bacterium]
MESLSLSIPVQHNYTDPTVERDVVRLQDWLSNLPLMDVVETVRLVLGALDALNEQKLDHEERFRFLEAYHATAQRLFVTVDPLHLRQLALTKSQRQDAIDGVERLFLSLAGGYKLIVTGMYETVDATRPDQVFSFSVSRALQQLSYALLDSYRFYRPAQSFLISESHQLYRLARHFGLLDVVVAETDDEAAPAGSLATLYHASMLLSLTDPFRLAEGEVGLLFDVLTQHASHCRIIPGSQWTDSGEGLFLVDLYSDVMPTSCVLIKSRVDIRDTYLLDARAALAAVRDSLSSIPAKVRMQSPEAMVLRRLLPEEGPQDKRREQRHSDGRWVNLLLGLESIHNYLLQDSGKKHGEQHDDTPPAGLSPSRVLDSSSNGMKLTWESGGAGDARVGDLLGVVEEQDQKQLLRLTMIRSIKVYREGSLEAGVQLLHGGLGAVYCCLPDKPDKGADRALFMPAVEEEQVTATLITPKGIYAEGCHLIIDVAGREIKARAGRLVLDTPIFDRFEFSAE